MSDKNTPPQKVNVYRHPQAKKTGTGQEHRPEPEWGKEPIKPKFDPAQKNHKI